MVRRQRFLDDPAVGKGRMMKQAPVPVPAPSCDTVIIGAGFIGTAIARAAVAAGHDTTVLTRTKPSDTLMSSGARVVVGDACELKAIATALRGPAHVIQCVSGALPSASVEDPAADALGTLLPLLNVLEAMRAHPGSSMTYLSSGGTVYGMPRWLPVTEDHPLEPIVPYGISKAAAERYVALYSTLHDIPARVLRLGNAYGPGQPARRGQGMIATLLDAVANGGAVPLYGNGSVGRDYVSIADVVDVVLGLPVPDDGIEVLNVGTGIAVSLREVIELVEQVTGEHLLFVQQPARPYDAPSIALDVQRLAARFAYKPTPLAAGIRDMWTCLQNGVLAASATR